MRLSFSGLETGIQIDSNQVSILEVENNILFSRICQSLISEKGALSIEPYSLWSDDGFEIRPNGAMEILVDPFRLPWAERAFMNALYGRMEKELKNDESIRLEIEAVAAQLGERLSSIGLRMQSNYSFAVNWEMQKYLKAFGFSVDLEPDATLLDNLIEFLSFISDASFKKVLAFVNLKTFLSENGIERLYEQAFFYGIPLFLLENRHDCSKYERERKMHIDLELLEHS